MRLLIFELLSNPADSIGGGGKGTAAEKIKKLKECGVHVADNLVSIGSKVAEVLG